MSELATVLGEREACARMGYSRASFQRHCVRVLQEPPLETPPEADHGLTSNRQRRRYEARQIEREATRQETARARRPSSLALSVLERQAILDAVHETRFIDRSIPHVYAACLDEGRYLGSMSTMYRVVGAAGEVGERRNQATRPANVKPELCAVGPGRVWSWDITKLHGPHKWTYYYLYVVIDIFSRYVVGWMVADRESSALAKSLLAETICKEHVDPTQLTIHADRGSSMKSKPVGLLLADLGVTKSHSRPHVSDDNPYIESHFRTLKYHPQFPATFANLQEARAFCRDFFGWYNGEHRHSGIALLTPADVHHGRAAERIAQRKEVLNRAYAAHPERFVRGRPTPLGLQSAVYINRPEETTVIKTAA